MQAVASWRRYVIAALLSALLALLLLLAGPFDPPASASTVPMVFPVEKRLTVVRLFMAPRTGHLHDGIDLWAPKMTKEMAVVSGTVSLLERSFNGHSWYGLWLAGDDGHGYFYSHVNNDTPGTDDGNGGLRYAFAPGLHTGDHVAQGQFIAYLGDSGNAESTSPHLHFQIHESAEMSSMPIDPFDSLYRAPLANGGAPPKWSSVSLHRYDQTNTMITYTGTWKTLAASGSVGGSYVSADSEAGALIWFQGTQLDLIAMIGPTQGQATVIVDDGSPQSIDLESATTTRQRVWSTGVLERGTHTVSIVWTGMNGGLGSGTRVNIDAVDVTGTLVTAPKPLTFQQGSALLAYVGPWTVTRTTSASGGSYRFSGSPGASFTAQFRGAYLALLAKTGPGYGQARVTLDDAEPVLVDLYSRSTLYRQKVWNTGLLDPGIHTLKVEWTGLKNAAATSTDVNIDALQILGGLKGVGDPPDFGPEAMSVIP
jgi:hypothetical protein